VAKIELAIKDAITRGADRRVRLVVVPLHHEVHRLRRLIAQLRRDVAGLRTVAVEWQRPPSGQRISEDEVKAAWFSARLRTLGAHHSRRRLRSGGGGPTRHGLDDARRGRPGDRPPPAVATCSSDKVHV
jgi:hypothetical protein